MKDEKEKERERGREREREREIKRESKKERAQEIERERETETETETAERNREKRRERNRVLVRGAATWVARFQKGRRYLEDETCNHQLRQDIANAARLNAPKSWDLVEREREREPASTAKERGTCGEHAAAYHHRGITVVTRQATQRETERKKERERENKARD